MLKIKQSERVVFVGQTGSGKTFLAQKLSYNLKRFVLIDSKGMPDANERFGTEDWSAKGLQDLMEGEPVRLRVGTPNLPVNDWPDYYDELFGSVFEAGDVSIYIDEMFTVSGLNPKTNLTRLLTQGREFNVSTWIGTQRPSKIPLITLSEAQHYFIFNLRLPQDRKRMSELANREELPLLDERYAFYYYDVNNDKLYQSDPIPN